MRRFALGDNCVESSREAKAYGRRVKYTREVEVWPEIQTYLANHGMRD